MDMNKKDSKQIISRRFSLVLLALSGTFLLWTPFAVDRSLAGGIQTAQACWFHWAAFVWASCVCLTFLLEKAEDAVSSQGIHAGRSYSFTVSDGLIVACGCVVVISYRWGLNPEPEKLLFGAQVVMLWFTWRHVLGYYPELRPFFLVMLLCTGLLEAVRGLEQLYGWSDSNHALFRLTGSFFNPGPYSGYLAALLPLCVGMIFRSEEHKHTSAWREYKGFYYFAWITGATIVAILPAGMSRSAWIAALVSCLSVYGMYRNGWMRVKMGWKKHPTKGWTALVFILLLFLSGGVMVFQMKKDSAEGRMLMWKITARAGSDQAWLGTGLGGFPAAYAAAQADYFASGEASDREKQVAGAPEYAFNEYLQIGLEEGAAGGLLFLLWIGSCLRQGIRRKMYGISGSILALGIFAFSSYPLQLPPFWVVWIVLSAYTPPGATSFLARKRSYAPALIGGLAGIIIGTIWIHKGYYSCYQQWNKLKALYHTQAYEPAIEGYQKLYEPLKHRPEFLFEGAQCLAKTGRPEEANRWLARAARLSADPMLHDVMARNEQALGRYEEAERHLLYAADVLPERIYPYYLLVKLYAEPAFRQPEKMEAAARQVLEKRVKVESTAVREMREEVTAIRLCAARQEIPGE